MPITVAGNLDYLIDDLRLHMGDIDSGSYRYTDDWMRTTLVASVKALMRWWSDKYLIDASNDVARNTAKWTYEFASPPIIQKEDERPIILMSSLILKGGSLQNSSWDLGHWKDAEISYSNVQGGKGREESYMHDKKELEELLLPPTKRLRKSVKGSLPGFINNPYETGTKGTN